MVSEKYHFTAPIWLYQGKGAWFFITVPTQESANIKFLHSLPRLGWGSVRVKVKIGKTEWKTSIFPDSKTGTYLIPVKADVRKKENITLGDSVAVTLEVFY